MNRWSMSLPLALCLVALSVLVPSSPAQAVTSGTYETQVLDRTNHYRSAHDRVNVKAHTCVDRWAEGQARWMAKHGRLEHRAGRLNAVMDDCGLTAAAENIAFGFPSGNSAVNAWMLSTGHRRNILRTSMRYLGVGAVQDDDGVWWVAQVFGTKK